MQSIENFAQGIMNALVGAMLAKILSWSTCHILEEADYLVLPGLIAPYLGRQYVTLLQRRTL